MPKVKEYTIKKGDTLSEIGAKFGLDWRRIWDDAKNKNVGVREINGKKVRSPRFIQVGKKLTIPHEEEGVVVANAGCGQKSVTVLRGQSTFLESESPRFDSHCHAHAASMFRLWAIACITPNKAQKAIVCNAEDENFRLLSNPGGTLGQVAVVPLMLDMPFCPLWNDLHLDSSIDAKLLATVAESVAKTGKHKDGPTAWDPLDIYPTGSYIVCDDEFDNWRDAMVNVHRKNPGYCFPFVAFDPRRPNAFNRVKECISLHGFVGIKLYTRMGWSLSSNSELFGDKVGQLLDDRVGEMLGWAQKNGIPVLNHCTPGGWPPDEHIAFPKKRFHELDEAETALRQYEGGWWREVFDRVEEQYHAGNHDNVNIPPLISAAGRMRHVVIGFLKTGETITDEKLGTAALEPMRPNSLHMTDTQFAEWIKLAGDYAGKYRAALQEYKRLTVAPDRALMKEYPKLRFCMAHCGSELIMLDKLSDDKFEEALEYANQHQAGDWLNKNVIKSWLDQSNAYIDLSFFSGIRDQNARTEVYAMVLTWLKEIEKTDRVLFGTDWPLSWQQSGIAAGSTWGTVRQAAEQVGTWKTCWNDITRENPLRFLGLDCGSPQVKRLSEFHGNSLDSTWLAAHVSGKSEE